MGEPSLSMRGLTPQAKGEDWLSCTTFVHRQLRLPYQVACGAEMLLYCCIFFSKILRTGAGRNALTKSWTAFRSCAGVISFNVALSSADAILPTLKTVLSSLLDPESDAFLHMCSFIRCSVEGNLCRLYCEVALSARTRIAGPNLGV